VRREAGDPRPPPQTSVPDFTRQENRIRGNTRTVRRQYAARKWTFVRVLPDIAGYCRVVGPWKFGAPSAERGMAEVVPAGTAWYRINFFPRTFRSGTKMGRKIWAADCGRQAVGHNRLGWFGLARKSSDSNFGSQIQDTCSKAAVLRDRHQPPHSKKPAQAGEARTQDEDGGGGQTSNLKSQAQVVDFPHLKRGKRILTTDGHGPTRMEKPRGNPGTLWKAAEGRRTPRRWRGILACRLAKIPLRFGTKLPRKFSGKLRTGTAHVSMP
jgi:hypothetical protein